MLGQQINKTREYLLENLENGKLIASQDVCFFEDTSPSELVVIDIGTL